MFGRATITLGIGPHSSLVYELVVFFARFVRSVCIWNKITTISYKNEYKTVYFSDTLPWRWLPVDIYVDLCYVYFPVFIESCRRFLASSSIATTETWATWTRVHFAQVSIPDREGLDLGLETSEKVVTTTLLFVLLFASVYFLRHFERKSTQLIFYLATWRGKVSRLSIDGRRKKWFQKIK